MTYFTAVCKSITLVLHSKWRFCWRQVRSGVTELGEAGHRQLGRAPLLQLQARQRLRLDQPAVVQQTKEVEPLAHLVRVGQQGVTVDQLLSRGSVGAVPQQNLQKRSGSKRHMYDGEQVVVTTNLPAFGRRCPCSLRTPSERAAPCRPRLLQPSCAGI